MCAAQTDVYTRSHADGGTPGGGRSREGSREGEVGTFVEGGKRHGLFSSCLPLKPDCIGEKLIDFREKFNHANTGYAGIFVHRDILLRSRISLG